MTRPHQPFPLTPPERPGASGPPAQGRCSQQSSQGTCETQSLLSLLRHVFHAAAALGPLITALKPLTHLSYLHIHQVVETHFSQVCVLLNLNVHQENIDLPVVKYTLVVSAVVFSHLDPGRTTPSTNESKLSPLRDGGSPRWKRDHCSTEKVTLNYFIYISNTHSPTTPEMCINSK